MEYQKVKSVAKRIATRGPFLETKILKTMRIISDIVGATLGPGGRPVLIERQEYDLPPTVTKDGVTVFRSLGFSDPVMQAVMETARSSSVRTVAEAGDGTTTATILAEAIVRLTLEYCKANPRVSPQRVVRRLEQVMRENVEPIIRKLSRKADLTTDEGRKLLQDVATISANGDVDLAKAVIQCFDVVGDDGNVTIAEMTGPSHYEVEKIEGFPIAMGYEESCQKFYPKFVNDRAQNRVLLEKPTFVLYHGRLHDQQSLFGVLTTLGQAVEAKEVGPNVVLVATSFSEQVLGYLAMMFEHPSALNVYPLVVPQSPFANGQFDFLLDLAAVTGGEVLDQCSTTPGHSLGDATLEVLGRAQSFEAYRFRSNVVGQPTNEDQLLLRVDELKTNLARAVSELDQKNLQERIGKLTGGIARLKVFGVSNGEVKEKRDRADDAVCAVRGAVKQGVLPGGCWALLRLASELAKLDDPSVGYVLAGALQEPFKRLLENVGVTENDGGAEGRAILVPILENLYNDEHPVVYDCLESKHVDAFEGGILDSTPAVLEAIRNSLSAASLIGTNGGVVVFERDLEVERQEARDMANFNRDANEANERA